VLAESDWDTLHQRITRHKAHYYRIPMPDGLILVLTEANVGEVIDEDMVPVIVALQSNDQRRMTSSRGWRKRKERKRTNWKRVGISRSPEEKRVSAYEELDMEPSPICSVGQGRHDAPFSGHEVRLPDPNTRRIEELARELSMNVEEPVELTPNGWPIPSRDG
jgi:hypothetical protein